MRPSAHWRILRSGTCFLIFVFALAVSGESKAVPLNPVDFAGGSLGLLPTGDLLFDTDNLSINGGGSVGVVHTQGGVVVPEVAVFSFASGSTLAATATITATGSRPLALLFQGSASILGTIDVGGEDGTIGLGSGLDNNGQGGAGGPGGFVGGEGMDAINNSGFDGSTPTRGAGPGAGGGSAGETSGNTSGGSGGGGGGHGTDGTANIAGEGLVNSDITLVLRGGSGGGGGGGVCCSAQFDGGGGGGGGGALEIGALTELIIGGMVLADGGDGERGNDGTDHVGGGGAGGGILLHAFDVTLDTDGLLSADGGLGGGCGGGGRIAVFFNSDGTFTDDGVIRARQGGARRSDCTGSLDPVIESAADIGQRESQGGGGGGTGVPEPMSAGLLGVGLAGLALLRRRRIG